MIENFQVLSRRHIDRIGMQCLLSEPTGGKKTQTRQQVIIRKRNSFTDLYIAVRILIQTTAHRYCLFLMLI